MVDRLAANQMGSSSPQFGLREPKSASTFNAFSLFSKEKVPTAACPPTDTFTRLHGGQTRDASCDGKFSWKEAGKNFVRGIVAPIIGLLNSPKDLLFALGTGALLLTGIAALGVAVAPAMFAIAMGFAGLQGGLSLYKMAKAKNGDERERAFYGLGSATGSLAFCAVACRPMLARFGVDTTNMGVFQAMGQSVRQAPASISRSYQMIRNGQAGNRLRYLAGRAPKAPHPTRAQLPGVDLKAGDSRLKEIFHASIDGPPFPMPDFRPDVNYST